MLDWFPKPKDDSQYLETWGQPDSNFDPEQPIDTTWHVDQYETPLGPDEDNLFERAVHLLLRYEFYPPAVMHHTSDFARENRSLRFGDRIVQRIHAIPFLLDVITMNRITATFAEPGRVGFTYTTTEHHLEMGEWTAMVVRKRGGQESGGQESGGQESAGQVALLMHAISKPSSNMPLWARPFSRAVQLRAHRLGMEHFRLMAQKSGILTSLNIQE